MKIITYKTLLGLTYAEDIIIDNNQFDIIYSGQISNIPQDLVNLINLTNFVYNDIDYKYCLILKNK